MVGGVENEGESMPRTRKSHPPSLKAKVAIEAIRAHKTAAQIAQMFDVHPTQVGAGKNKRFKLRWREQSAIRPDADQDVKRGGAAGGSLCKVLKKVQFAL